MSTTYIQRVSKHTRGFSLIELLVSMAIVVTIAFVALARYSDFDSVVLLRSLAYEIALSVREAQTFGVAVVGDVGTFSVSTTYGVHFEVGTEYHLFIDNNPENGRFDTDESITTYTIGNQNSISNLCTTVGATETCGRDDIDIMFTRPDLEASYYSSNVADPTTLSEVAIEIASKTGNTQRVTISAAGQIEVD